MSYKGIVLSILTLAGMTTAIWSHLLATSQAAVPATPQPESSETSDSTSVLLAQFPVSTPTTIISGERSITVTGIGQASIPADQAVMQIFYYSIAPIASIEYDPTRPPEPIRIEEFQFIRNALTAIGIPANNIALYADPNSYGSVRLQVTLPQPTSDRMNEIIVAANDAVIEEGRLSPGGTSVIYTVNECAGAEDQARREAVQNGRDRAVALAEVAGVTAGEILTLSEYSTWGLAYSSTCPRTADLPVSPFQIGGYGFDPTIPPEVSVTTQVTATYAIEED